MRNLIVLDEIKAPKVLAEKLNIKTGETDDAGKSKVFVTATTSTGGQTPYVVEKVAGESFKVKIDNPTAADIIFDWWIVN